MLKAFSVHQNITAIFANPPQKKIHKINAQEQIKNIYRVVTSSSKPIKDSRTASCSTVSSFDMLFSSLMFVMFVMVLCHLFISLPG